MNALALGGADCVWDDVAASEALLGEAWWDIVVACNDAGAAWPERLDHWVSLHPDKLEHVWKPRREGNQDYETWSNLHRGDKDPGPTDHHLENWGGSSGLFCVTVALEVGADRIVVCGMPMESQPHFHGINPWEEWSSFRQAWEDHHEEMDGRVRSMSGWTRQLLGAPSPEWLAAGAAVP